MCSKKKDVGKGLLARPVQAGRPVRFWLYHILEETMRGRGVAYGFPYRATARSTCAKNRPSPFLCQA